MGLAAAITGSIGAIVALIGVVEALDFIGQPLIDGVSWTFWFGLAAIIMLGTIALAQGRGSGSYD